MDHITIIAPKGNLVVAIGEGSNLKLVKVLSVVLELVSPVFDVMLGPNFYEGRVQYDTQTPLQLPADQPNAMINMLRIFHYRNEDIEKYPGWITDLFMVADKYGVLTRLKSTVQAIIADEANQAMLSTETKLVISGLTNLEEVFADTSEELLRRPLDFFEEFINKDLRKLLPDEILDGMREYRREALDNYQTVLQELKWKVCTLPQEKTCCQELHENILAFLSSDVVEGVANTQSPDDIVLENIQQQLYSLLPEDMEYPDGCVFISYCDNRCTGVARQLYDAIYAAAGSITHGTNYTCELCIKCFRAGQFGIRSKCELHRAKFTELKCLTEWSHGDTEESETEIPLSF